MRHFTQQHKIKREQYAILFRVADRRRAGKINMFDWGTFENLLAKPDAEYEIAFRLFDLEGTGTVKYEDLKKLYKMNKGPDSIPFDWDCEWATLYSGGKKRRHDLTYPQFSQMLRGLQGERIRQAFHHFDKDGDGYIEPEDFQRIILETAKHKLSDHLLENLHTLCNISAGSKISYANVRAFQNMIREMDLVEMIIRQATAQSADGKITRTEFLNEAARITRFSLFTPMEADILFHFASLDEPSGRLGLSHFAKVLDASWRNPLYNPVSPLSTTVPTAVGNFFHSVLESVHHFALGSLAGAFGAFMVYPIDLVKTRMQNQRSSRVGQMLYKNSWDCAKKVVKNEGFRGLYSGVLPQLVGVAPEKAIKLTVNDLVRGHFSGSDGSIWIPHEILAGGTAGACQVVCLPFFFLSRLCALFSRGTGFLPAILFSLSPLSLLSHAPFPYLGTDSSRATDLHQPPRNRQDPSPGPRRGREIRRRRPPALRHVDCAQSWSRRSLQRRFRVPAPRCALLSDLLPYI
jgi:solute carrier family 25 aspartate/glutamate transporter 12/13